MKPVNTTVYEADDGTRFPSEAECVAYEKALADRAKRTTYWVVHHNPDLTEGRGFYGKTYVECYGPESYNAENFMVDWCFRSFNRPVAFVQGVAPTDNWVLRSIDRKVFLQNTPAQVGDYKHEAKQVRLVIGPREEGLILTSELPGKVSDP